MRRLVVFLVALAAWCMWIAGDSMAGAIIAPPREVPPGGILVHVDTAHCYTPDAPIRITVKNLSPGSSVQTSSEDTVSVTAKASSTGTATLTLSAPSGLPHGRSVEAHLITVVGTDATGQTTGEVTAFVLAKRRVCERLKQRR